MLRFQKNQLKKELQQLFPAPAPQRKEEFLRALPYPKARRLETISVQIGYIRTGTWALSLLAVAAARLAGQGIALGEDSFGMLWCLSAAMPLLAVLAVTETFRSSIYGMAELEMAAKYNLPQVLLVRMGALGAADFLLMLLGMPWVVQGGELTAFRAAVYLMAPWLGTCAIAFQIEKHVGGRESIWYCAAFGLFLGGGIFISRGRWGLVYGDGAFSLWLAASAALAICLARQIWQIRCGAKGWKLEG